MTSAITECNGRPVARYRMVRSYLARSLDIDLVCRRSDLARLDDKLRRWVHL